MIDPFEAQRVARRVGDVLDATGIPWVVVGSLASSFYGVPRATQDVDIVAIVDFFDVDLLVDRLLPLGYVDRDAVHAAARQFRSFNFIDDRTCDKVDVFCVPAERADEIRRAKRVVLAPELVLPYASAEDTVAQKLRWFERGGRVSDRQWRDIVEVLQVQGERIDGALLDRLAGDLGVEALLAEAFRDAAPSER